MTADAWDDDYFDGENGSWVPEPARPKGLSKSTVDFIFDALSGDGKVPEGSSISQETVDAMRLGIMTGDMPPPNHKGRFEKGSSGNPNGRPRRVPEVLALPPPPPSPSSLGAITLRSVSRQIKARTDAGETVMTLLEGVVTQIAQGSVKGNTGHARTLTSLVAKAELVEASHKRDVFRYWSEKRLQAVEAYGDAKRARKPMPLSVHPDDIQLNADGTVTILGPTAPGAIVAMRNTYRRMSYHLVNIAYQRWMAKRHARRHGGSTPDGILYAELDFMADQAELPPRLRLSAEAIAERSAAYNTMCGRALHTVLRQEAGKFGKAVPPRSLRAPTVVTHAEIDAARDAGVAGRAFLDAWLAARTEANNR